MRPRRRTLAGIAAVAAVAIIAFAVTSTSSTQTASQTRQMTSWWSSGGQVNLQAVTGDLLAIKTDAGNYDLASLEADGSQLASDAQAALDDPPPAQSIAAPEDAGMRAYVVAGNDLSNGNITGATTEMNTGNADINQATAAVSNFGG